MTKLNIFAVLLLLTCSAFSEKNFSNAIEIQATTPIAIDAKLTDWESNSAKPIISTVASKKFNIEKMYLGEDDKNVYFAFQFSGDYKKLEGEKALEILLDLDNDQAVGVQKHVAFKAGPSVSGGDYLVTLNVEYDHTFTVDVFREHKGEFKQKLGKTMAQSSSKLASKENVLEFKISKATFAFPYQDGRKFEFDEPLITIVTAEKDKYAGEFSSSKGEGVKSDISVTLSPLLIGSIVGVLFYLFCFAKIFKKAGFSSLSAISMIVPPLGFAVLNFSSWAVRRKIFRIEDQIAAYQEEEQ